MDGNWCVAVMMVFSWKMFKILIYCKIEQIAINKRAKFYGNLYRNISKYTYYVRYA